MSEIIEYRDWLIWQQETPIPGDHMDWQFTRKNAVHDDGRDYGHAPSLLMAQQSCDYADECDAEAATPEGKAKNEADTLRLLDKFGEMVATTEMARALDQLLKLPGIGNLPGFATGLHIQRGITALANYSEYHPGTLAQPRAGEETA